MDPIEGVNIEADTTFLMTLKAQDRGHRLWVYHARARWRWRTAGVSAAGPAADAARP